MSTLPLYEVTELSVEHIELTPMRAQLDVLDTQLANASSSLNDLMARIGTINFISSLTY